MAGRTRDRDLGWREFQRQLREARTIEVVVGVQQGEMNGDGEQIATYAAANEFGTEEIPERSFMRSAFDENVSELQQEMEGRYQQMMRGALTTRQALGLVGLKLQDMIKDKISSNIPPPNSEATIERKGSSRTLIDTSAMKNSIHYIYRPVNRGVS